MFEFCGELSNSCKLDVQKNMTRVAFYVALLIMFLLIIPIIILAIMWNWIMSFFLLIPILVLVFVSVPQLNAPMKTQKAYLPNRITIDNGLINLHAEKLILSKPLSAVKKVVDVGEWYHIKFYFGHKSLYFVCQKNLLTKGSIEEFEQLFEEKIELKVT